MAPPTEIHHQATGRRKTAVARVRIVPGDGAVMVNSRPSSEYFGRRDLETVITQPLRVTDSMGRFVVTIKVIGGGIAGQAGAVCHGIARALVEYNGELRKPLKNDGLLTRDARAKERKKYGMAGARKRFQFSKR